MGPTSTSTHERVYKFVVPAEEEDNPRPLDLIGDYGLFPKSEVLVDLHNGSDNQREGSEHTTFPIKAELAFWSENERSIGISVSQKNILNNSLIAPLQTILNCIKSLGYSIESHMNVNEMR